MLIGFLFCLFGLTRSLTLPFYKTYQSLIPERVRHIQYSERHFIYVDDQSREIRCRYIKDETETILFRHFFPFVCSQHVCATAIQEDQESSSIHVAVAHYESEKYRVNVCTWSHDCPEYRMYWDYPAIHPILIRNLYFRREKNTTTLWSHSIDGTECQVTPSTRPVYTKLLYKCLHVQNLQNEIIILDEHHQLHMRLSGQKSMTLQRVLWNESVTAFCIQNEYLFVATTRGRVFLFGKGMIQQQGIPKKSRGICASIVNNKIMLFTDDHGIHIASIDEQPPRFKSFYHLFDANRCQSVIVKKKFLLFDGDPNGFTVYQWTDKDKRLPPPPSPLHTMRGRNLLIEKQLMQLFQNITNPESHDWENTENEEE